MSFGLFGLISPGNENQGFGTLLHSHNSNLNAFLPGLRYLSINLAI